MTTKYLIASIMLILSLAFVSAAYFEDSASLPFNSENSPTQSFKDSQSRIFVMTNQDGSTFSGSGKEATCPTFTELNGHKQIKVQNVILFDSDAPNINKAATLSKDLKGVVAWYMYGGCADDKLRVRISEGQTYSNSESKLLFSQKNYQGDSGTSCKNVPQAELPVNVLGFLKSNLDVSTEDSSWVTLASYAESDNADKHNLQLYSCIYTSCDYDGDGLLSKDCGGTDSDDFVPKDNGNGNETDTTAPGQVKNLIAQSRQAKEINWIWTNPSDSDFSHVVVSINGNVVANTSSNSYRATNLNPNTAYTISLRTVDSTGNINNNAVSNTANTLPLPDTTAPIISISGTTPSLPFVNNGSEEKINVRFVTNEYPLTVYFKLYDFQNSLVYTQGPMSYTQYNNSLDFIISEDLPNGDYRLEMEASDLSSNTAKVVVGTFSVFEEDNPDGNETDTTPPAQVTDLKVRDKGKSFIEWQWANPSDSDFASVLIYLDGEFVAETSGQTYKATGLDSNTEYTITIYTKDNSNNTNSNGVSLTSRTDKSSNGGDDDDDNDSNSPRNPRFLDFNPEAEGASNLVDNSVETIVLSNDVSKVKGTNYLAIVLLALSLLLIIILLVILFSMRN